MIEGLTRWWSCWLTTRRRLGPPLALRGVATFWHIDVHREIVRGACHLEVQVALIVVEDVVDLLPAKSLEALELRFRAGTLPIVKETGLGHLLLIIRRVLREERLISRLLLERLDLILPLLV